MPARKKRQNSGKKNSSKRILWIGLFVAMFIAAGSLIEAYRMFFSPAVHTRSPDRTFLYIPTGANFETVMNIIRSENILERPAAFEWFAKQMDYPENIKPGKYKLEDKMNAKDLLVLLRSGRQTPVKLVFHNIRTKNDFAGRIAAQIEADSLSILRVLNDNKFIEALGTGMSDESILCLFLPNTYEFWWNTNEEQFVKKMATEYEQFWTKERKELAKTTGLNPIEVSIIASIVQQETRKVDEMPVIAGVYLNRQRKNWKLEADPTLVFAAGDFTIQRVLNVHKAIDSPFNTYMYPGIPPGPICIPSLAAIKSVLNYERHDFMFFCAKEDFSGYHSFAKNYNEHLMNARRFQKALDKRNIKS